MMRLCINILENAEKNQPFWTLANLEKLSQSILQPIEKYDKKLAHKDFYECKKNLELFIKNYAKKLSKKNSTPYNHSEFLNATNKIFEPLGNKLDPNKLDLSFRHFSEVAYDQFIHSKPMLYIAKIIGATIESYIRDPHNWGQKLGIIAALGCIMGTSCCITQIAKNQIPFFKERMHETESVEVRQRTIARITRINEMTNMIIFFSNHGMEMISTLTLSDNYPRIHNSNIQNSQSVNLESSTQDINDTDDNFQIFKTEPYQISSNSDDNFQIFKTEEPAISISSDDNFQIFENENSKSSQNWFLTAFKNQFKSHHQESLISKSMPPEMHDNIDNTKKSY